MVRLRRIPTPISSNLRSLADDPLVWTPEITAYITWGVVLAILLFIPCACFLYCIVYRRWRAARLEEQLDRMAIEREREISRIAANVMVFSEHEQQRRIKTIQSSMQRYKETITADDLTDTHAAPVTNRRHTLENGCSICLEAFLVGDDILHSHDTDTCRHLFHEHCLLRCHLLAEGDLLCPTCRQVFAHVDDSRRSTSTAANDEPSSRELEVEAAAQDDLEQPQSNDSDPPLPA